LNDKRTISINNDFKSYIERFPAIPPGTDEGITLTPPLNLLAIDAAATHYLMIDTILPELT
jgi:hypothetical protein